MSPRLDGYRGINLYEETYRLLRKISHEAHQPITKIVAGLVDDYLKAGAGGSTPQDEFIQALIANEREATEWVRAELREERAQLATAEATITALREELQEARTDFESFAGHHKATELTLNASLARETALRAEIEDILPRLDEVDFVAAEHLRAALAQQPSTPSVVDSATKD